MSRITLVVSVTYTLTEPEGVPAGTMAALALTRPSTEFSVDTTGWPSPLGQIVRYPRTDCGTTVTFSEYATALAGILHGLPLCESGKERAECPPMGGPPNVPLALRVSTTRHGVSGTNCTANGTGFTICVSVPLLGR